MSSYDDPPPGAGSVVLGHDQWRAVVDTLDGFEARRDDALDAMHHWVPSGWLRELDARDEAAYRTEPRDAACSDDDVR